MKAILCALAMVIAVAGTAHAQTVANPTKLEFDKSASHDAVTAVTGVPLLDKYEGWYYLATACNPTCPAATVAPAFKVQLGKPSPDAAGHIVVPNVFGGIQLNQLYKAVVYAFGPGGSSPVSNVSNPFGNETVSAPAAVSGVKAGQ